MIIVDCQQGSPAWHSARAGAITASMFATARARLKTGPKKGDFTTAGRNYAFRLAIERISGKPLDEGFETFAMKRGHELEPMARAAHQLAADIDVQPCGFVLTEDRLFGASADGLIGDDGGSEYKCLIEAERLREVHWDENVDDFIDQVQGCMWITGRKFWHLGVYCPALQSIGKELWLREFRRDDDYIEAMEHDLLAFNELVCAAERKLRSDPPPQFRIAA